jgi:hypothetical protein
MAARSTEPVAAELTPLRRGLLNRRVRLLVAATIAYNVIEAIVAISAGAAASSTALIGFGLDSVIEVASASAVAWQFTGREPENREAVALRVIALSFFALAAYIVVESVRALCGAVETVSSPADRAAAELVARLVLGRPVCRSGHRRCRAEGGPSGLARPPMLLTSRLPHDPKMLAEVRVEGPDRCTPGGGIGLRSFLLRDGDRSMLAVRAPVLGWWLMETRS